MRTTLLFLGLCLFFPQFLPAQDLQPVPENRAHSVAARLVELADKIDKPQVKIEADASKANGFHVPSKLGVLVVPQKDLKEGEQSAAKTKVERGAPLAYLFAYQVVPLVDGKRVDVNRLRTIKVTDEEGQERRVHVLLLAVRQLADDDYRLYGYGQEEKPLVEAKFSEGASAVAEPVAVEIKEPNEQTREGNIVVTVFKKYRASFRGAYVGE
jgi:hypothetical protein